MKRKKRSAKYKAWEHFSRHIRLRGATEDGWVTCFSCGIVKHWTEVHAGHYIAKSLSLTLRFNEINVQVQCVSCNLWKHGNLAQYALALKKKYGDNILEELDQIRREGEGTKITEAEYRELAEKYKGLIHED